MASLLARLLTEDFWKRIPGLRGKADGLCGKCGADGPVGEICDDCGCARFTCRTEA